MVQEARENDLSDPSPNVLRLVEDSTKRIDAEIRRIDDKLESTFEQFKESASRETKRVDDNREADNRAVLTAANKAEVAATLLQGNVLALAETLRKSMETNAQALALQLTVMEGKLSDRTTKIENIIAENKGESKSSEDLPKIVKSLELLLAKNEGKSGVSNKLQMVIVGIIVTIVEAVTLAVIFNVFKSG